MSEAGVSDWFSVFVALPSLAFRFRWFPKRTPRVNWNYVELIIFVERNHSPLLFEVQLTGITIVGVWRQEQVFFVGVITRFERMSLNINTAYLKPPTGRLIKQIVCYKNDATLTLGLSVASLYCRLRDDYVDIVDQSSINRNCRNEVHFSLAIPAEK